MNKKFLNIVIIFMVFAVFVTEGYSQGRRKPVNRYHARNLMYLNNIRLTGMVGLSSYYGDLCDQTVCFRYRPGLTVGAYYRYSRKVSFRGDITYLRLSGTDKDGKNAIRNLSFRSPGLEVAAGVMYDLIPFDRNYRLRAQFTPYIFLEAGMLYFNPKAEYNGTWYSLRAMQTEGVKYNAVTFAIPFGGGIRYKLTQTMDLSLELSYRKTFTDYIDDISTEYIDNSSFSDPIAGALADRTEEGGFAFRNHQTIDGQHFKAGATRGNPSRKDGYFMFGFKFEYMIKATAQLHNLNSMPGFRHKHSGYHRKYR